MEDVTNASVVEDAADFYVTDEHETDEFVLEEEPDFSEPAPEDEPDLDLDLTDDGLDNFFSEQAIAQQRAMVVGLLDKLGVGKDQLEAWKARYKDLYTFYPGGEDIYLYRPLFKPEWDRVTKYVNDKITETTTQQEADAMLAKIVVRNVVLFPKLTKEQLANARAGLVETLFQVIMQASYFFSPQAAAAMTIDL